MGPVDLSYARNCLKGMSARSFFERYKRPALILSLREGARAASESSFGSTLRAQIRGPTFQAGVALLAPKHESDPAFGSRRPEITMGRSKDCDIAVRVATVSSCHVIFEPIGGEWTIVDQGSTNGTFLDDRRLDAGERHILASGDTIMIGPDLAVQFLMPRDLLHYLLS